MPQTPPTWQPSPQTSPRSLPDGKGGVTSFAPTSPSCHIGYHIPWMILGSSYTFIQALSMAPLYNCNSSDPPSCPQAALVSPSPGTHHGCDLPLATPERSGLPFKPWCKRGFSWKPSLGGGTPFSWLLGHCLHTHPQSKGRLGLRQGQRGSLPSAL